MKIKIRIISSYRPSKETERRFGRLASLILESDHKGNSTEQKEVRLDKTVSEDIFS